MAVLCLNQRIQKFYDRSTQLWLHTWGEHMHHGYYGPEGRAAKDRLQAQADLIEALLSWGKIRSATRILDAGCGVGGSARYLARRFGAQVLGVTLSPVQARAAAAFTKQAGLEGIVEVRTQDMMTVDAADGPFDLIWCLESAEHIADKQGLLEHFRRLLCPGGRLVMATWCRRSLPPSLDGREQRLLTGLCRIYHLPPMVSREQLVQMARNTGFGLVQSADWTAAVAPFWDEVIRSALNIKTMGRLLRSGWSTIRGAWAMRYMRQGYRHGLIRYAVMGAEASD